MLGQRRLRGDFGRIVVKDGANIQDNCVMHGSRPGYGGGRGGHIGYGAILHGCVIGRNALVGMGAVIIDGAVIGENSIVGASAFVKANAGCPPTIDYRQPGKSDSHPE